MTNIILNTDSYKYSMPNQYPKNTSYVYSYIESRGSFWNSAVFFGLQGFIKEYLIDQQVTKDKIDEAESFIVDHGLPFYREGWEYILNNHNGVLPVRIKAVPEGSVIPNKNVLVTIENTDPKCWWLTTHLETSLLRAVWYPTTVCTNSYEAKKIILKYLIKNGDENTIDYKLHDFGARGVSSYESSEIGGSAHLVNFKGTDTISALRYLRKNYNERIAGHSIPAMEHSTVTSWTRQNELNAYDNMLNNYASPNSILACVSDSYDIYNACKMWGTELKDKVINSGAKVVIRPDSGFPPEVVMRCVHILDEHFGHTLNSKGYKVLNHVSVIQGDGIDHEIIHQILNRLDESGFSSDNIAFGWGGGLLQVLNRDTMKFALKCSAICVDGQWRDVYKEPITDFGKKSKKGRVTLYKNGDSYISDIEGSRNDLEVALNTVFENGVLCKEYSLEEIRQRASI